MAGNEATQVNPPEGVEEYITQHGSDWLWAVFAIMAFTDLVVLVWHFMIPRGQRVFHQLAVIILTTASIAYFTMASNLGYAAIATEFAGVGEPVGAYRQIWYTRYIDWVITTPALLLTLVLASGLPLSDIITLVFFDLVMIITGLIGALVVSTYKWGFYTFGCVALFYIWWVLAGPARTTAGALGANYKKTFTVSASILSFLWLLYPIAWGLADGGNVISPDSEMIFYGVLDVLAKPVYTIFHLYTLSKLDLTALQLSSGKFSTGAIGASAGYDAEKAARHGHVAPADHDTHPSTGAGVGESHSGTGKKGFFGKKGRYDANTTTTAPTTANNTAADAISTGQHGTNNFGSAQPRLSEATAVSQ